MMRAVFFVAIGGAAGSVMRYLTSALVGKYFSGSFPAATLVANVIGCLAIGLLMGYFLKTGQQHPELRWLLITGFCGGYTTFSAFAYENLTLFQQHNYTVAFGYIALSIAAGLAAVWCGLLLNRAV